MRVRARLFARQREIAGSREVVLEVADGAKIEDAWAAVVALHPGLADGRPYVRFALNGVYASPGTPLAEDDEVACIPPVSGGSGEGDEGGGTRRPAAAPGATVAAGAAAPGVGASGPDRILELAPAPLPATLGSDLADRLATPADGAVVIFEGRTRETPGSPAPGEEAEARRHAGRRVEALDYEAFEPLALRVLNEIADAAAARYGVERLAIVHATGEVPLGEVSVVVVACAPHRDAAFDAARFAMDETKARAPIWKAERFADGHVWIGRPAETGALE
jgi:molybdopterin synthase catalytic subunit/molybdopterin converting factor small subunit